MKKSSIWAIVFLVGLYITCQLVADVGATKMVQVGRIVMPGGTFLFAVTFTLRDLIHKRLGADWARVSIIAAACFNVLLSLYLAAIGALPAPVFYPLGKEWGTIFAIVPAITLASIVAEVVSELIDTAVFQFWWVKMGNWPQWTRVLVSNAVSLPVDSLVFGVLAFSVLPLVTGGATTPIQGVLLLVQGQVLWKLAVTVLSLPAIYLVKEKPVL